MSYEILECHDDLKKYTDEIAEGAIEADSEDKRQFYLAVGFNSANGFRSLKARIDTEENPMLTFWIQKRRGTDGRSQWTVTDNKASFGGAGNRSLIFVTPP